MASTHVDRNLLFGIIALQMEFVTRDQLIGSMHAWVLDKQKPLGQILVEHGALAVDARAVLDALVTKHVELHQDDPKQSLAALRVPGGLQRELGQLADSDVQASLVRLAGSQGPDPQSTMPMGEQAPPDARFEILRSHASGGLGEVFVALDREVNREVALKRLQERHAGNPDSRERFLREGEITGALEHPGIVPVYGLGLDHDGRPYYAMRFIRGQTLKEAIESFHSTSSRGEIEHRIELRRLLTRLIAVCNAIGYAHSRGVIHRDLKPSNIMLGKHGETLVVDWGLCKALGQRDATAPADEQTLVPSSGSGSSETLPGSAIGTPAYMSPEQAAGRISDTSQVSDVYSLGATLYSILTGAEPFEGPTIGEILAKVQSGRFPPPRERDKSIAQALDSICLKAMSLSPKDRYPSCAALASDIEHWMADEPITAWREPVRVRAGRWVRKHRTGVATALATLVVAVFGLLAVSAVQIKSGRELAAKNRELRDSNARLAEARDRAEQRVQLAVGAVENFRTAVDGHLDVKNRPENAGLRKSLLQAPLSFYQKLRDDLRASGDVGAERQAGLADAYFSLASINRDIGSQTDALTAYNEAAALLEGLVRDASPAQAAKLRARLAQTLGERGSLQRETKGMTAAASASLQRAKELWEAALRENPDDIEARVALATTLDNLAMLDGLKGNVDAALAVLRQSLAVLEEGRRRAPKDLKAGLLLAATHLQMSEELESQRARLPDAMVSAKTAQEVAEPLARAHPADVGCQMQLSEIYSKLGRLCAVQGAQDQALEIFNKRLALVEKMIQVQPTVTRFKRNRVEAISQIATAESALGKNTEALANLQKARDLASALVLENPTNVPFKKSLATIWSRLPFPLYALGRLPEALAAVEAGAVVREEINRAEPNDVANVRELAGAHYDCGVLNHDLGKTDAALKAYDKALELQERLVRTQPDNPFFALDLAGTLGNVGIIQDGRENFPAARLSVQRASDILQKLVAAHPENAEFRDYFLRTQQSLGHVLLDMGRSEDGLKALRVAQEGHEQMVREHPDVLLYQQGVAADSKQIGGVLQKLGKADDAMACYQKANGIFQNLLKKSPGDPQIVVQLGELLTLEASLEIDRKHPADAVRYLRSAVKLVESLAEPTPPQLYDLACYQTQLATVGKMERAGVTADEVRDAADKAMATLTRAVSAGYRDVATIRTDRDLDPLRKRQDFQKLLKELEKKESAKK